MKNLKKSLDDIRLNDDDKQDLYEQLTQKTTVKPPIPIRNLSIAACLLLSILATSTFVVTLYHPADSGKRPSMKQRLVLMENESGSEAMLVINPTESDVLVNGSPGHNPTYTGAPILLRVKINTVQDAVYFTQNYSSDHSGYQTGFWNPYTPIDISVTEVVRGTIPSNLNLIYNYGGYVPVNEYTRRYPDEALEWLTPEQRTHSYVYISQFDNLCFPETKVRIDDVLTPGTEYLIALFESRKPDGTVFYDTAFNLFGVFNIADGHYINAMTGQEVVVH